MKFNGSEESIERAEAAVEYQVESEGYINFFDADHNIIYTKDLKTEEKCYNLKWLALN